MTQLRVFFFIIVFNTSPSAVSASQINGAVCFRLNPGKRRLRVDVGKLEVQCDSTHKRSQLDFLTRKDSISSPLFGFVMALYARSRHRQWAVITSTQAEGAHINTHFFKWFIEFLPGVERFCFGPSCFWGHFCVFSDIELPCTTSWCHRKQWEADIYNWNIPAMPNGLFAVSPTKVYFAWPSGTESVENNTTYTLLLPVIF